MVRSTRVLTALVALALLPSSAQLADAQTKKKGEAISGTVVSIEKAKTGRSYMLKMKTKSDEIEYDVPLVPRTHLVVSAQGDQGFLKANAHVGGIVTADQNPAEFECSELFVYLGTPPPPQLKLTASAENPSAGEFEMSGKIVELQKGVAQIQCGQQPIKVSYGETTVITVKSTDALLIKEGDVVEIEGTIVKSKQQINANTVTVTSAEPITSREYFAAQGDQKGKSAKTAGTAAKTKKDTAAEGSSKEADPFGVLNKSKTKAKSGGGAATPAIKEAESDPFGVLKNKAKAKAKASGAGTDASEKSKPATKKVDKPAKDEPAKTEAN